jgi:hypothetical protein
MSGYTQFNQKFTTSVGEAAKPVLRMRSSSVIGFDFTGANVQMMAPDEKTTVPWTIRSSSVTGFDFTGANVQMMGPDEKTTVPWTDRKSAHTT